MENKENAKLRKEIGDLKLEVARLWHVLKLETGSTTKHFKETYRRTKLIDECFGRLDKRGIKDMEFLCQKIADLYDIVSPIENKVFPHAKEARQQMKKIVGPKRLGAGKDLDKRKGD